LPRLFLASPPQDWGGDATGGLMSRGGPFSRGLSSSSRGWLARSSRVEGGRRKEIWGEPASTRTPPPAEPGGIASGRRPGQPEREASAASPSEARPRRRTDERAQRARRRRPSAAREESAAPLRARKRAPGRGTRAPSGQARLPSAGGPAAGAPKPRPAFEAGCPSHTLGYRSSSTSGRSRTHHVRGSVGGVRQSDRAARR